MGELYYPIALSLDLNREQVKREVAKMQEWLALTEPKPELVPIDDE